MNNSDQFWKYTQEPYGSCPLQAEGSLISGEKFYFRFRWGVAELTISPMDAKHGLDNPIWYGEAAVKSKREIVDITAKPLKDKKVAELIEGFLMDYLLSVEGKDFDDNQVVSLETHRRRQYIKKQLEKSNGV